MTRWKRQETTADGPGRKPVLTLSLELPADVRGDLARALPLIRQGKRPGEAFWGLDPRPSEQVERQLECLAAFTFRGRLWVGDAEVLESFEIPSGRPAGEWRLPDLDGLFGPAAGRFKKVKRFTPLFALDERRLLFTADGYDKDLDFLSMLAVFDAEDAARPWMPLQPAPGAGDLKALRCSVFSTAEPNRFLYGEIRDGGAAFHIDEFIDVPFAFWIDLERGVYEDAPEGTKGRPCPAFAPTSQADWLVVHSEHRVDWEPVKTPAPPVVVPATPGMLRRVLSLSSKHVQPEPPAKCESHQFLATICDQHGKRLQVERPGLQLAVPPYAKLEMPVLAATRNGPHLVCVDLLDASRATARLWLYPEVAA